MADTQGRRASNAVDAVVFTAPFAGHEGRPPRGQLPGTAARAPRRRLP